MVNIYLATILNVVVVSLISFVGVFSLPLSDKKLGKIILFLVSLSAGALLGDSFIHLLPEAIEKNGTDMKIWLWLLAGILVFFVLEKIIHWRHCHVITTEDHPHPVGLMNLVGDGLHNLTDGMIIAGSFLVDYRLGIATTIAVIIHEIPQEIGDYSILIYAGYSRAKALLMNFISGTTAIIGAILILIIGANQSFLDFIIPFTAGGFIYIATADLIPELKKDTALHKTLVQFILIILGIVLMILLKKLG